MKARILHADDDGSVRAMVKRVLEAGGHQVRQARDGVEAIDLFHEERPDLIVLDVAMPRLGGLQVLAVLNPAVTGIPVVLLTALRDRDTADFAEFLGASRTFAKPFDVHEFLDAVRDLLAA